MSPDRKRSVPRPQIRRLRAYAFDPSLATELETAVMNQVTLEVPWEVDADGNDILSSGPAGEYVEVLDQDQQGRVLYPPVDLNDPYLLAQDGLPPSDGNPQFHQQMVYAVVMRTIRTFESALGRRTLWAVPQPTGGQKQMRPPEYVPRLRIFPHYFPEPNAYYLPGDNALAFGYFRAAGGRPGAQPGALVFTCLSHDIVAHELTHALLYGMHIEIGREWNPDVAAFHEAFADLVALFQHFSLPGVLHHQIAATQGNVTDPTALLGGIAQQFGRAVGEKRSLRTAIGTADPEAYHQTPEAHARGAILVSAIFDAFVAIYKARTADLMRIASEGTGILPEGALHPDLVGRLADEAAKSARHVLDMCIRALDYCPAIDITFGDFLRAIITADYELVPDDVRNYRVAFVEAFRRHGIFPTDVSTLALDTLLWPRAADVPDEDEAVLREFIAGVKDAVRPSDLWKDRRRLFDVLEWKRQELKTFLQTSALRNSEILAGIDVQRPFEIRALRSRERTGPDGEPIAQWVIDIVQGNRRSCTLVVDLDTGEVRYSIRKLVKGKRAPAHLAPDASSGNGPASGVEGSAAPLAEPTKTPRPTRRRLRVFAFDPSLAAQLETSVINEVTLSVPWEVDARGRDALREGPVGEYLEVVDRDPASGCFYEPVDLNDLYLLAQDGLPPSDGNPKFHQQMVYAVAMRTIRNFERALGRRALWAPRRYQVKDASGKPVWRTKYVQRLRVYPHALREANAFYSPAKKALLFGYFRSPTSSEGDGAARPGEVGGGPIVFTCLSHDIVAHEVTHALLDGMHRRFAEPSNPDVLALHEAFADIVALFQHFSLPEALRHQIAITRGDLASQNRLGELAQQFGQALGQHGALRSAIGQYDEQGRWEQRQPDPGQYVTEMEPHARGALLVAAVFDAFLTVYKSRVADLLRIASKGTGVLPAGQIHPDLVQRLANEAAKSAQRVLEMCIRALDYCPPVDVTFGDYLRAIITADHDLWPSEVGRSRIAFIEAFRRHGLFPDDVKTLSVESLLWPSPARECDDAVLGFTAQLAKEVTWWNLSRDRRKVYSLMNAKRRDLHTFLRAKAAELKDSSWPVFSGLDLTRPFEVHSLRPSIRRTWDGQQVSQWVIEITQRRGEFFDPAARRPADAKPDFYFRGGTTLLVDADTGHVRYSIAKPLTSELRLERQRRYQSDDAAHSLYATYFDSRRDQAFKEPFAILHRYP